MALPNEDERKAIVLLRDRVKDVLEEELLNDDFYLLRWIRARELDLIKSEQMLRTAIEWRKSNNVDEVLDKKIDPFFTQHYPRFIGDCDKEGRPLYIALIGQWDVRTVVRKGESKGFLNYTTHGFELLMRLIKEANDKNKDQVNADATEKESHPPISQVVSIFDFAGFAWGQLLNYKAVGELLQLASIYEAYYPEILHSCYFINCPSLISAVFALLKPILAPKTMNKIQCFGTQEWQSQLLKVIDKDKLLTQFGGEKEFVRS